jgi:hypothetical protein
MDEKVLGFKVATKDFGKWALIFFDERNVKKIKLQQHCISLPSVYESQLIWEKESVPVVSLEWLEKEIERLKKKAMGGVNSEYARAWDDGYGSAMRDVISITKGEAAKFQAGEKL